MVDTSKLSRSGCYPDDRACLWSRKRQDGGGAREVGGNDESRQSWAGPLRRSGSMPWHTVETVTVDAPGFAAVIGALLTHARVNVASTSRPLPPSAVLSTIPDLLSIGGCVSRNFPRLFYPNFEVERWRPDHGVFSVYCVEMECAKLASYFLIRHGSWLPFSHNTRSIRLPI